MSKISNLRVLAVCLLMVSACASTGGNKGQKLSVDKLQKIGENYLSAGDTGLALQYLTRAEKLKPNDPVIHYDLGLAYGERGLPDLALEHFKKSLVLNPDYAEASNALGVLYAEKGQYTEAEAAFNKALANPFYQTPYYVLYNLGQIYEKRGDLPAALEKYQQAIRIQPAYAPAYLQIGMLDEKLGNLPSAMQNYEKALQYNPSMAEALLHIGLLSYREGEFEKAYDSLARVVRMNPDSDSAAEARKYLSKLPAGGGS